MRTFTKKFFSLYTSLFAVAVIAAGALFAACEEAPGPEPAKASKTLYILISGSPIAKLNTLYKLVSDPTTLPAFASKYSNGASVDTEKPAYHARINGANGLEDWYVWASSDGYRITQVAPQAQGADEWILEHPNSDPKAPDPTQVTRWIVPKAGKSAADVAADPYNTDPSNPTYGEAPLMNVSPRVGITNISITQPDASNPRVIRISVLFEEPVDVAGSPSFTIRVGGPPVSALYISGSGETTLVFGATLTTETGALTSADNAISPPSGAIKDVLRGNDAITTDTAHDPRIVIGGGQPPAATGVSVTPQSPSIAAGATVQLAATVAPSGANQSVTWSSNNPAVASVNANGLVSGAGTGTATITATTQNGVQGSTIVTVTRPAATSVSVTPQSPNIQVGATVQLAATVAPSGADQSVTWSSNDPSIASVNANGLVTGNASGTVSIVATAQNGVLGTTSVTVTTPAATGVTVTPTSATINVGQTVQFSATVFPQGADPTITWSSYNPAIASVDATGLVTGVSPGDTRILARANNGTSSAPRVIVRPYPTSVDITPNSPVVQVNGSIQLRATVNPSGASQTVTWSSDDPSVASVDQTGLVTGNRVGSSTRINATAHNGIFDRVSISVVP